MRILQTCHAFYPRVGGTEDGVLQLSKGLIRAGHEVTVVTSEEPGTPMEETIQGIRVKRVPFRVLLGKRVPRRYWPTVFGDDYDLVSLQGQAIWSSDFLFPVLRRFHCPKVFTAHGFYYLEMRNNLRDRLYYRYWVKPHLRRFDGLVSRTRHEQDILESWGIPPAKIRIIHHGVHPELYAHLPTDFKEKYGIRTRHLVLYVGGFFENKRVDRVVQALKGVPDVTLVAVGREVSGSPVGKAECDRLAKDLGVPALFPGILPPEELYRAYGSADIVALGSQFEGFGGVLVEAMAAGKPFVAFDTGAARELAETGSGVVVRSVEEMQKSLRSLLTDDSRRETMGAAGLSHVSRYSWQRAVELTDQFYRELAAGTKR